MSDSDKEANFLRLTEDARGRWREIIGALARVDVSDALAAQASSRTRHVKCPGADHGRTRQQFRLFSDFDDTGGGICNTCGAFPSGFKLLSFLNGWDFRSAVREVAQYLEGRGVVPTRREIVQRPKEFAVSQKKLDALQQTWATSLPVRGSIAELYLKRRGITCELPSDDELRFHPSLHYWDKHLEESLGHLPGMIALLKSPATGQPITIHRTYLSTDGTKARVCDPKKLMPAAVEGAISELGGSIQLYPATSDTLAVCEGIETALSIRSAHPHVPIWACYSASVLTKFRPPTGVRNVVIWADRDNSGTGQVAAARLALELDELGIETVVKVPGEGPVFVKPAENHWATRRHPIERLIDRLREDGYTVSESTSRSIDWADVWKNEPDHLREEFA